MLRPVSAISSLEVWQYYTHEELAHGAPYDLDTQPAAPPADPRAHRRLLIAGYAGLVLQLSSGATGSTRTGLPS